MILNADEVVLRIQMASVIQEPVYERFDWSAFWNLDEPLEFV